MTKLLILLWMLCPKPSPRLESVWTFIVYQLFGILAQLLVFTPSLFDDIYLPNYSFHSCLSCTLFFNYRYFLFFLVMSISCILHLSIYSSQNLFDLVGLSLENSALSCLTLFSISLSLCLSIYSSSCSSSIASRNSI